MTGHMQWTRQQKRGCAGKYGGESAHMARIRQQQALFRQAERIDARTLAEKVAKPSITEPEK